MKIKNQNKFSTRIFLQTVFLLAFLLAITGCVSTPDIPQAEPPPPSTSFLYITPFIGDETSLRDPAPQTERMILDNESIEGWTVPAEKILRFPVDLREGARFTVFFGLSEDPGPDHVNTRLAIEFRPEAGDTFTVTENLFDDINNPGLIWLYANLPLDDSPTGPGEICLVVEPQTGDIPDIEMLWGAPSLYYPEERRGKNVLLIGVDTLRADSVGAFGGRNEITPVLNEFLSESTIFTQARAQSSWTLPSFASMITGKLPSDIGATITTGFVPSNATTIGEILLPDGYTTMTICTNVWLGNEQSGFQQGMEEFWYVYDAKANEPVDIATDFMYRNWDRDWFCFLHFIDPHSPYEPPEEFREKLTDPSYNGPYSELFRDSIELKDGSLVPVGADLQQIRDLYDGEVAHIDAELGRLFNFMEETELLDETLIIFASDHGEEFADHNEFDHGHTHYDEMIKMPLGVYGDGFPAETSFDTPVGNMDIVPTILEWLGMDLPPDLSGIPLQDVLDGNAPSDRIIFGEGNNRGPDRKFAVQWPYKCIRNFNSGEMRFYDLENDPMETTDIYSEHTDIADNLGRIMTARMLPDTTAFHAWFMRNNDGPPAIFEGTITIDTGFEYAQEFGFDPRYDTIEIDGNTISFKVVNSLPESGIDKHIAIFPTSDDVTIDVALEVNSNAAVDYLYPYGTTELEPSGSASVHISEYPLGPDFETHDITLPPGLYIWGVQGFDPEIFEQHFDPETWDEIRSLGYIN